MAFSRLVSSLQLPTGEIAFATKGRSEGMASRRAENTRAIFDRHGIARKLRDERHKGVFHLVDLEEAKKDRFWLPCPSDDYPDAKTLMVAPINWHQIGVDGRQQKVMGGMLFVTSWRDNLGHRTVEPLKGTSWGPYTLRFHRSICHRGAAMKSRGENETGDEAAGAEAEPKLRPVAVEFARALRASDEAVVPSNGPAPAVFVTSTGAKIDLT